MSIDDYRPHFMVEAVYDLKPDQLREHGIRAVLVDLDNTLIAWNNPDGTPELRAWLDEMTEADIPVVVVSNNKHERVERAVEVAARRPQLQERLTDQVATALEEALNPRGVFVMVEAEHMCMTMRGIKKPGSKTITTVAKGLYKEDREERKEILSLMRDF